MTASEPRPPGLRARKKAQTRRTIQEQALRLFLAKGYENTTVEEIAAAAEVSHMTFFRHFPTKEAVVETDDYDPMILQLIAERPEEEDTLTALHRALAQGLRTVYATDREALLIRTRLVLRTPALRARVWENQHTTEEMLARALASRRPDQSELATRVLTAAALAALTTALTLWVDSEGTENLPALVDQAFTTLQGHNR
ncbi:TetR/AcrR family transcriptional regulator [Streptomyces odontomachi]|uniref:TetR/AcrR family transcriptional regulator n=1 Tax=Streptomyces odontomachi TaxID=2944940 RepID=UPI00210B70BF|nr:TetR/AcrR family transcriptional regulator [Streptomyces sp. ODS25]